MCGSFSTTRYTAYDAGSADLRSSRASFASSKASFPSHPPAEPALARRSWSNPSLSSRPSLSARNSFAQPVRSAALPAGGRAIDRLPQEVMDCVIEQLKVVHRDPLLASCATCYQRDLHSMCMTSKTWRRAARPHMYVARDSR